MTGHVPVTVPGRDLRPSGWPDRNAAQGPAAIVAAELVKTYPGGVQAVRGISFSVAAGESFGLLGPNGAGKTTTIGMLNTTVRPTSGRTALRERTGVTVLLTTHYLDEAERLCDRLAIIDGGRIVACDTPARLLADLGEAILELRVAGDPAVARGAARPRPARRRRRRHRRHGHHSAARLSAFPGDGAGQPARRAGQGAGDQGADAR